MDVWINGKFVSDAEAQVSVFDAGLQHGIGLFETLAARNGGVFRTRQHIERLTTSAEILHLSDKLHVDPLVAAVRQTLDHSGRSDARIRITVTGGDLNLLRSTGTGPHDPTIIIVVQPPTEYPDRFFTDGIAVTLAAGRLNPWQVTSGHKTLDYWNRIAALQTATSVGAGEALWLTPEAHVASGSVSNLFLTKNGTLVTPPARGEQPRGEEIPPVRPGVTREAVMEIATRMGVPVECRLPVLDDVLNADEVFLTNSSWQVLPVTGLGLPTKNDEEPDGSSTLGHHPIADGVVGTLTADLRAALLELIASECDGSVTP